MEINNRGLEEGRGFFGLADFLPACSTFCLRQEGSLSCLSSHNYAACNFGRTREVDQAFLQKPAFHRDRSWVLCIVPYVL